MLFALLAAGIYTYVGWRLGKRIVSSSEGWTAWQSFTIWWWYGLAVSTLIDGHLNLYCSPGIAVCACH